MHYVYVWPNAPTYKKYPNGGYLSSISTKIIILSAYCEAITSSEAVIVGCL